MPIQNFLDKQPVEEICHNGEGWIKIVNLLDKELSAPIQFIHYTVLPPGTSIGLHTHKNDQEIYIVLEGIGVIELNGKKTNVKCGDVILNKPFGSHALYNTLENQELKILVIEAVCL